MKFKDMTDKELVDMVNGLHNSIYVLDCYGSRDMIDFHNAEKELLNRGITIKESQALSFVNAEGEEIEEFDKKGNAVIS